MIDATQDQQPDPEPVLYKLWRSKGSRGNEAQRFLEEFLGDLQAIADHHAEEVLSQAQGIQLDEETLHFYLGILVEYLKNGDHRARAESVKMLLEDFLREVVFPRRPARLRHPRLSQYLDMVAALELIQDTDAIRRANRIRQHFRHPDSTVPVGSAGLLAQVAVDFEKTFRALLDALAAPELRGLATNPKYVPPISAVPTLGQTEADIVGDPDDMLVRLYRFWEQNPPRDGKSSGKKTNPGKQSKGSGRPS